MKFKVGDYVKIIRDIVGEQKGNNNEYSSRYNDFIGKRFRISLIRKTQEDNKFIYSANLYTFPFMYCDDELELTTKEEYEHSLIEEEI